LELKEGINMNDQERLDVRAILEEYFKYDGEGPFQRDASWGYCFNFFHRRREAKRLVELLPGRSDHELACLHLASYLSSWGMYRGKAFISMRSAAQYGPLVELIVEHNDSDIWECGPETYTDSGSRKKLFNLVDMITDALRVQQTEEKLKATGTLQTKIMLGVYGCVPAFDEYVGKAVGSFTTHDGVPNKSASFCDNNIKKLGEFWRERESEFEALLSTAKLNTFEFSKYETSLRSEFRWTKAKLLDAILFTAGGGFMDRGSKMNVSVLSRS
jgi:hypothetical protein